MRIPTSPQLSLRERVKKNTTESYWKDVHWTRDWKSCVQQILEAVRANSDKAELHVLAPILLSKKLSEVSLPDGVNLAYYPVTETMDPDWNELKQEYKEADVDVFLFSHFFGVYHDANRAKTFCKQKEAILIEDAGQCLYDYQKVGQTGDFVLYSAKKLLAGVQGAWVVVNRKDDERQAAIVDAVLANPTAGLELATPSYEDLKRIAYVRRENMQLLRYFMEQVDSKVAPLIPEDCECPYEAVFSLAGVSDRDLLQRNLKELGLPVTELTADVIALPLHQGIEPRIIAKCMRSFAFAKAKPQKIVVERIGEDAKDRWDAIYHNVALSNIPQHWAYGDMKAVEGWKTERFLITCEGKDAGLLQLLSKRVLGLPVAYRVNRGPIFLNDYNTVDMELAAMAELRKKIFHPSLFFYVPYSVMSAENYIKTVNAGWRNWNVFGYPSGTVDLTQSEEDIRKGLNSKWRNQLKTAEKYGHEVHTSSDRFDEMMRLYDEEQKEKGFDGENPDILRAMQEHPQRPFRFFYVEDEEGKLLAYDIFYRHDQVATYFIGWNSEEGRKQCLNNLLLYQAAVQLKAEGVMTMDLGGIEYIETEAVAKFKDGMMPEHYRQMGEFLRIG